MNKQIKIILSWILTIFLLTACWKDENNEPDTIAEVIIEENKEQTSEDYFKELELKEQKEIEAYIKEIELKEQREIDKYAKELELKEQEYAKYLESEEVIIEENRLLIEAEKIYKESLENR